MTLCQSNMGGGGMCYWSIFAHVLWKIAHINLNHVKEFKALNIKQEQKFCFVLCFWLYDNKFRYNSQKINLKIVFGVEKIKVWVVCFYIAITHFWQKNFCTKKYLLFDSLCVFVQKCSQKCDAVCCIIRQVYNCTVSVTGTTLVGCWL